MSEHDIFVTKSILPDPAVYQKYLEEAFASNILTNEGKFAVRLEQELTRVFGVPYLGLCANGTLSLQLAIHLKNLPGREVITTPFTYVATATALLWEHCVPVFADVEEDSLCLSAASAAALITENTGAIMPVHIYGNACDVEGLDALAAAHGIPCIYDAAQATGCLYKGKSLLAYGDVATCSFHATKVFHTVEGGGVVCRDPGDIKRLPLLRAFGHRGERYEEAGINAKMSELHAIMGLALLPRTQEHIEARRRVSEIYDGLLSMAGLRKPALRDGLEYNYSYYPLVFEDAARMERAQDSLREQRIFPRRYFAPAINTLAFMPRRDSCPVAEDAAKRVLCLPLYADLAECDVARIADIVNRS